MAGQIRLLDTEGFNVRGIPGTLRYTNPPSLVLSAQTIVSSTGIEWTDRTWNPVRGCSRVSEGCRNCYAEQQAARFIKPGQPYSGFVDKVVHEEPKP